MKRGLSVILLIAVLFSACAPKVVATEDTTPVLKVTDGTTTVEYTAADMQAMTVSQASFKGVSYLGIPLAAVLQAAGFDPQTLSAVKVTAVDGFSVNYDSTQFRAVDTLVSFARVDGPLGADELPFRMVLPAGEGKVNVRQVVEIMVIP
jgi:hypothetical protein